DVDYTIYAHSGTTLYTYDPATKALDTIGDFDCVKSGQIASATDLAGSADQKIWAVSSFAAIPITVQGSVAHCETPVALTDPILSDKNKRFYALTFAPSGVLGFGEVLVAGNTAGELWAIDANGNLK